MTSQNRSGRSVRWMTAVLLAASVAGGVTGCSSDSDSGSSEKPAADASSAAPKEQGSKEPAAQSSGPAQASAREAVATFATAVVKGEPEKACLVMAQPAAGSQPAQVGSAETCNSDDPTTREMRENVSRVGESVRPKNLTGEPKVEVAEVPPADGKVLVPAGKITVNGQPLDDVIVANSTGVTKEQLDVKVESSEIEGAWWVTNVEYNIG
ncbi:hypothetical protein ACH4GE_36195 [Streptomyces tendae]|uniref:hypothetical protein n=1 Tax=Streptomyces tendae TaxID=1932 RepID=UPI00379AD794